MYVYIVDKMSLYTHIRHQRKHVQQQESIFVHATWIMPKGNRFRHPVHSVLTCVTRWSNGWSLTISDSWSPFQWLVKKMFCIFSTRSKDGIFRDGFWMETHHLMAARLQLSPRIRSMDCVPSAMSQAQPGTTSKLELMKSWNMWKERFCSIPLMGDTSTVGYTQSATN